MKVAILGGGISGLSTYIFLKSHLPTPPPSCPPHSVTILEAHAALHRTGRLRSPPSPTSSASDDPKAATADPAPTNVGGGFGVAPNGMAILRRAAPALHARVAAAGFATPRMQMQTAGGWALGAMDTAHADERLVAITWQALWEELRAEVADADFVRATVRELREAEGGRGVVVVFGDGREEEFDLVVGTDGVRSAARKAILGEDGEAYYTGVYSVGGFMPASLLPTPADAEPLPWPRSHMVMTMGPEGFFGYGPFSSASAAGPQRAMWWSSFSRADPGTHDADVDAGAVRAELRRRHAAWADPAIHRILEHVDVGVRVATWVTPKLRAWHGMRGRVVLAGDAAHTMPSSSGQGVSQALSDALAVSLLLQRHLGDAYEKVESGGDAAAVAEAEGRVFEKAWPQYERARKAHVEEILDQSLKMNDWKRQKGWLELYVTYAFMWLFFTFGTRMQKALWKYQVWDEVDRVVLEDEKASTKT